MSWTPATSIDPRAAYPSTMRILSVHRESTGLCRSHPEASDPVGKDSPRFVHLFILPLDSSESLLQPLANRLRTDRGDARAHSRQRKWAYSAQFWCNVSPLDATLLAPLVCVANKGLAQHLSSLHATLTKNIGGGGSSLLLYILTYLPPLILSPEALSGVN